MHNVETCYYYWFDGMNIYKNIRLMDFFRDNIFSCYKYDVHYGIFHNDIDQQSPRNDTCTNYFAHYVICKFSLISQLFFPFHVKHKFNQNYERLLKNNWLWVKENIGGQFNFDSIQQIYLLKFTQLLQNFFRFTKLCKKLKSCVSVQNFSDNVKLGTFKHHIVQS